MNTHLPVNRSEMEARGWDAVDFVYVCGDAYVDHPSFGAAIITRLLESLGFRVGFLAQPDWRQEDAIREFGRPRLGFMISAGNMDSMVNHYSVARKHRHTDAYSPGGEMGHRPDRAVIVYGNWIRRVYPDVPIIAGGIEASLRRLAHYDYWSDSLRPSLLVESQADLISYGMGERSIREIAEALAAGIPVREITWVRGTCCRLNGPQIPEGAVVLPSWNDLHDPDSQEAKRNYARSFGIQYANTDPFSGKVLVESYGKKLTVVQNPPALPLSQTEMDAVYALPYTRKAHPMYEAAGGIPALAEVKFSLTSNRGCFGGCSFCALTFHQGRIIQTRSHESILAEAREMIQDPEFKGYIHDVGGPTADLRHPACQKQLKSGACVGKQCLFPKPCRNLTVDHQDYMELLRKLRALPGVKKVFIRSGIRFDYVMADPSDAFLRELCRYHVSGQLKVAPEHVSGPVLRLMGKPSHEVYRKFAARYARMNEQLGKKQYLVPYLISSHPGSTLTDAVALAEAVRDMGYMPEQVQDFYPTPATISTCMYYTGLDPRNMKSVAVERDPHRKAMQRALIQYRDPDLYELVKEALIEAGREDLIGYQKECLIPPRPRKGNGQGRRREERSGDLKGEGRGKKREERPGDLKREERGRKRAERQKNSKENDRRERQKGHQRTSRSGRK